MDELTAYLECESIGVLACDRQSFEEFKAYIIFLICLILLWIFPIVNLVYVISVEDIKETIKRHVSSKQLSSFAGSKEQGLSHLAMNSIASVPAFSVAEEAAHENTKYGEGDQQQLEKASNELSPIAMNSTTSFPTVEEVISECEVTDP